jgi:alpha-L-fucosidase
VKSISRKFLCCAVLILGFSPGSDIVQAAPAEKYRATEPVNLALHKPTHSSSIENDEHSAAQANDGDPNTSWTADDEPENGPEWWMVDLEKPCDLSGCRIRWPFAGKRYRYKVEGSGDCQSWFLLSDQTKSTATAPVHELKFSKTRQVRYFKITVTGLDQGCWASISEVQVFGPAHAVPSRITKSAL